MSNAAFNQYTNGIMFQNMKQKIERSVFSTPESDTRDLYQFCLGACNSLHTPY